MKKRMIAFLSALALMVGLLPAGTITVATAESTPAAGDGKFLVGYSIKSITPWVSEEFVKEAFKTDIATVENPNSTNEDDEYIEVTYISDVNTYTGEDGKEHYYIGQGKYNEQPLFSGYSDENCVVYPYLGALVGNQVNWKSLMTAVYDDSGDKKVNGDDGIFATCTAVTYGEKTVLFITTDTMKAYSVSAIRDKIVKAYGEEYGITQDQIMISSNHTHSSLQLTDGLGGTTAGFFASGADDSGTTKMDALNADRAAYLKWALGQITAAAGEALETQAVATMSKGSINATEATAAMGYNEFKGYQMNAIRHYEVTATVKVKKDSKVIGEKTYISSNASPSVDTIKKMVLDEKGIPYTDAELKQYKVETETKISDIPDNTMHVLRFDFEDERHNPVVFVNWRAHSTMNSSIYEADPNTSDTEDRPYLSSDYANGLRTVLRDQFNCRAAFFLGAAGNVVAGPAEGVYGSNTKTQRDKMDWLFEATKDENGNPELNTDEKTYKVDKRIRTFVYGKLLAEIANYCMTEENSENKSYMTQTEAGEISTYKCSWKGKSQIFSEALIEAAEKLHEDVKARMSEEGYTDIDKYDIDKYISDNGKLWFPYHYVYNNPDTGNYEPVTINTRLHYNKVVAQKKNPTATVTGIELNTIMLGPDVAFIVSPGELVDYYHDFTGDVRYYESDELEKKNDWFNLEKDDNGKHTTYGMPFVLGYSNGTTGYIASWLDFNSNSEAFYKITGKGEDGPDIYSPGTYESLTSSYAMGEGEELIKLFDKMLDVAAGIHDRQAPCQHCSPGEDVTWKPLFAHNAADRNWVGHRYLVDDLLNSECRTINSNDRLCLDLNGHTIESKNRAFNTREDSELTLDVDETAKNAIVSIMDSSKEKTGKIIGNSAKNNPYGGTIKIVGRSNTLNIYGGTFSFNNVEEYNSDTGFGTGLGGVIALTGILNLYGGTIQGADMVDISERGGDFSSYFGMGGAVFINGGYMNVYGGSITSGTVPETGVGPCVYLASSNSKVSISRNATIDDIYFKLLGSESLTISNLYTGTVGLTFGSQTNIKDNTDIGKSDDANLDGATITCKSESTDYINAKISVYANGDDLKLSVVTKSTVAMAYNSSGRYAYNSLQDAVNEYEDGYIRLIKDETNTVTISEDIPEDVYLDLAGFDVSSVNVRSGTLYVMDSNTDDYTVKDDYGYGKITNYSGNIAGVPLGSECAVDGYLKVEEENTLSFHRITLQISSMALRPHADNPGLYYNSYFAGDEMVAEKVEKFGVALSATGEPNKDTISDKNASKFDDFKPGPDGNDSIPSTLLYGIMKTTNKNLINNRNANVAIYGRAYVLLDDGTYLFGQSVNRTLRRQVEMADDMLVNGELTNEKINALVAMCESFSAVTRYWDIPNIHKKMN